MNESAVCGVLLGTAVGDALGLPREGLTRRRAERLYGTTLSHRLILGKGMVSDDTEHACFVAAALFGNRADPAAFQHALARMLRWWLLGLPAGVGLATLKGITRLWFGVNPSLSGVRSAGNGPAMRSALLGVVFGNDDAALSAFVLRSTQLTHSDPKAYHGALIVAVAAHLASTGRTVSGEQFLERITALIGCNLDEDFNRLLRGAVQSADRGETISEFTASQGMVQGISGYIVHTVTAVVQVWLRHQDTFAAGVEEIILAGGDTDTTGAILGGIIGARVGKNGIPVSWLEGIIEWPRSVSWIEAMGQKLASQGCPDATPHPPRYPRWGIPLRNLVFLAIILGHGLRRMMPPY
jgi:ADP-ribosylglycohydrolase